ncbi:ATP-binding protein [Lacinutrix chionoecetis]
MKLKYIVLFFVSMCCFSQENTFYHYGLEEGLSQETVLSLLKDSSGFLWIGTQDGLNRFDGNSFTVYKNSQGDTASIVDNYINALLEHDNNTIWIGTATNGVCYYNPQLNIFNKVGKKRLNCTGIAKDKKGRVYATYLDSGLSVFSIKNEAIEEFDVSYFKSQHLKLSTLAISDSQMLYVGSKDGRLFHSNLNVSPLAVNEIILNKNPGPINKIFIEDSKLWLGTSTGLYIYHTETNKLTACNIEKLISNNTEKITVNNIITKGDIYYISTDNGLFELTDFDVKSLSFKSFNFFKGDSDNLNSITSSRVYTVLPDTNKLFIGTNKLDVKPLTKKVFKTINTKSESPLNNNHVYSILKDENYVFVGTRGGLNCIDRNGTVLLITKENTNQKLASNVVRGISKDKENNLWLTTTKGVSVINLNQFNPENPQIKTIYSEENNPSSLSFNNTRSTYIDHNNTVWICTYGGGLSRFTGDLKTNTFTFQNYRHDANTNSLSSDFVFSITQDEHLNYWIATGNGLNKLQFKNNDYNQPTFTSFYRDNELPNALNNNTILSTFHDKNTTLWVASQDGLHQFNESTNTFKHYGKNEGLNNTFVYGMLEDDHDNLWLTTNSGIFKFNKETEIFTNYNTKDGVQSSEFNLGPIFKDEKTNTFYFGGVNGFNYFNPDDVDKLDVEGDLIFTSLKIKGEEINPIKSPDIISENITKASEISLKYNEFPSAISFSELDFRKTKNNQFVYKLLPNNDVWNELNDTKEIQLLDLPKGNFTLLVQGKTRNKLWQKEPLQIRLNVLPPWYKSNLAYALYALLGLSVFFLFYRFQIQRKLAHQEASRLRELNDLRNKLYTNITHEFRTPITVISGMAENLKEKLSKTTPDINAALEMIERNSNNLLNLVNQMLDLAKLEKGKLKLNLEQNDIVAHARYLTESLVSYAQEKEVSLVFYNEDEHIIMDYDANKVTQIISNLISNAIKFCDKKSKVIVHVSNDYKNEQLILKVKDSGKGITEEDLPFIFDRFYQAEFSKAEGSGIGLALTKELVELMNGSIKVESKPNIGTTFTILLPITNTAEITTKTNIKSPVFKPLQKLSPNLIDETLNLPIALIVEDNKDVASYINLCLQDTYQIINAYNGEDGINMAIEHIPDIIVSDIMMPKKNGFELCETLKQDIKTNHIPIILLTAKASQQDKISGLSIGADAYLTKPFNKEELLIRINQLIELRKTLQHKYKLDANFSIPHSKAIDNVNDTFINNVIQSINKNIEDSNFNAFYLARAMHLSESQLYRKLKALTNTSTAVYIRKIRLLKAKELLQTTTLSVSEIAYATGFNDPSWFSKAFKEEFNVAPSDIRN